MPLVAPAVQTRRTEEPEPELLPLPVRTVGGSFPSSPARRASRARASRPWRQVARRVGAARGPASVVDSKKFGGTPPRHIPARHWGPGRRGEKGACNRVDALRNYKDTARVSITIRDRNDIMRSRRASSFSPAGAADPDVCRGDRSHCRAFASSHGAGRHLFGLPFGVGVESGEEDDQHPEIDQAGDQETRG